MSINVYVNDWNKQPKSEQKVYIADENPNLSQEDLEFMCWDTNFYKRDEKGIYELRTVYENPFPELNFSNHNFELLFNALDYQFDYCGYFPFDQLPEVNRKIIKLINTGYIKNASDSHEREGNFIHVGQSIIQARRKYNDILSLIQFAIQNNKSIYWG